jgi:hypothetical protein
MADVVDLTRCREQDASFGARCENLRLRDTDFEV